MDPSFEASKPRLLNVKDRAFLFAVRVIKLCRILETHSPVSNSVCDQLLRAATSAGANLEEAKAGQSRADFVTKCTIAQKEARETHYWLRLLAAAEIVRTAQVTDLLIEADEINRILASIIVAARKNAR